MRRIKYRDMLLASPLDRTSMILAASGAALGFVLFLATEYLWIV